MEPVSNKMTLQETPDHNPHLSVTFEEQPNLPNSTTEHNDTKSNVTSQSIINKSIFNGFFPIRILEKIPLIIKLILIVSFCLIPMSIFGALLISNAVVNHNRANEIKKLSRVTICLSEMVDSLQNERGVTSLYLGSHKKQYIERLKSVRNQTNLAISAFLALSVSPSDILINDKLRRAWGLFEDYLDKLLNYTKGIEEWRVRVEDVTNETFIPTFQYINDWNSLTNDLIRIITSQSLDPTFSIIHNSYTLMSYFKEFQGIRRFLGSFGFLNGSLSEIPLETFKEASIKGSLVRHFFYLQISNEVYEDLEFQVLNNTQYAICQQMERYVIANHNNLNAYTVAEWFENMTLCMDSLRNVEDRMKFILSDYSNQLGQKATDSLIAFAVSIVVVLLLAFFLAILFSKTILGPWKKMLRLQEDVVYKFVPREFMSIINKEKVTDLHHGDYFEKELDIMFVDIRNYTSMSERIPTDQMFKFLNRYLTLVGPIVRRNSGYIDKYMGDGFIALFTEPGHALKASIEIHNCIQLFNETLAQEIGPMTIGCGIVRGSCAVGLIGESKRMDPTIVGDSVNLSSRLESLTKYYDANILVSKSVIDSSSTGLADTSWISTGCFRSIGRICVMGRRNYVEVIEILPFENSKKRSTKELFEKAIAHLFCRDRFNPEAAEQLLGQVSEIDPEDKICKMRLLLAQSLMVDSSHWDFVDAPNTK